MVIVKGSAGGCQPSLKTRLVMSLNEQKINTPWSLKCNNALFRPQIRYEFVYAWIY